MSDNQLINIGSVQAPYQEFKYTIPAGRSLKIDYVFQSFNLLYASIENALRINFGGAVNETYFKTGMGYKLTEPVQYIILFNDSTSDLQVDFALAIGEIQDNRLSVSGAIQAISQDKSYSNINAQTLNITTNTTLDITSGDKVNFLVKSGSITVSGLGFTNYQMQGGESFEVVFSSAGIITLTGTGTANIIIARY